MNSKCALASALAFFPLLIALPVHAQLSLRDAVRLAMANSTQVEAARNDLQKAKANLAVMKDIYIPSVTTSGGVGYTTGITLSVPTVFTVGAQSLVFSYQQREYLRAARAQLEAASSSLEESRRQVEEDVVITFVSIAQAEEVAKALGEQFEFAQRLTEIDEDRQHSGLETELEVMKARRSAVQIKLYQMQTGESIQNLRGHLSSLTGLPFESIKVTPDSIPRLPAINSLAEPDASIPDNPGIMAAEANARAKQLHARGDAEYEWRPIITFGAQYGRVSPINNVSQFYNLRGNYNTTNVGIQIQIPLVDRVRHAAAQESRADASQALLDLQNLRAEQNGGRAALKRSLPELATKVDLAQLDLDIAQNELSSTTIQLRVASGRQPLTPKEEQTAHIEERQKYLDLLDTRLRSEKAEINYLRQIGKLSSWLDAAADASLQTDSLRNH